MKFTKKNIKLIKKTNKKKKNNNFIIKSINEHIKKKQIITFPSDFDKFLEDIIYITNLWNSNSKLKKSIILKNKKNKLFKLWNDEAYMRLMDFIYYTEPDSSHTAIDKKINEVYTIEELCNCHDEKKLLTNEITNFHTFYFLSDMTMRLRFIKLIIITFSLFLNRIYNIDKNYNKDNLNIIFKGGTVIRFQISEFIRHFNKNIEDFLYINIAKSIKMSDFDFEIISSPNMKNNDFSQINLLTFFITIRIKQYLSKHKDFFFTFFKENPKNKIKKINQLKKNIQNIIDNNKKIFKNTIYHNCKIDFIDFEGCYYSNLFSTFHKNNHKKYMSVNNYISDCIQDTHKIQNKYCKKDFGILKIDPHFLKDIKIKKMKNDYINYDEDVETISISNLLEYYGLNIKKYTKLQKLLLNNPINEYNRFICSHNPLIDNQVFDTNLRIKFQLNRIKYLYNIYFTTKINVNNKEKILYLKQDMSGEIFDLSHAYPEDRKKNKFLNKFTKNKYLQEYKFLTNDLNFLSYSVEGQILDINSILYQETFNQPWKGDKYNKRLKRLIFLFIFYFFSDYVKLTYNKKIQILSSLIKYINNDFKFYRNNFNIRNNTVTTIINNLYESSKYKSDSEYEAYKIKLLSIINNLYNAFIYQNQSVNINNNTINNLNNNLLNNTFIVD